MNPEKALRKDLTPDDFKLFRDWIHQHSGIFLEESKVDSLRISLVTRATRFDFTDYRDYFRFLSTDEDEFKELMNLVTINETSFFRFPAQFEALRDVIIPEIIDARPSGVAKDFRVWSAGCSTGEEPYTIAMTLLESCLEGLGQRIEVVGTDVSTQALDRARKGVYPDRTVANLDPAVVSRWFERVEGGYRPVKRVRDLCAFHYHNLIKEPYPLALMSNWDIIFCRNVTIYFRIESIRRVVDHYYDALNPGGYLFIGHSETLTSISDRFEPVEVGGVFLYRKANVKRSFSFDEILARRERRTDTPHRESAVRPVRPVRRRERLVPAPEPEPQPSEVELLLAEAQEMLDQARAGDALVVANSALSIEPDNVRAHLVAAFSYADLGKLDEAAEQAETVLATYPLTAAARYVLGIIHQQRGETDEALADFKRTIYIDADFVLAHFAIANLQRQLGHVDDACRGYQNTLRSLEAKPEGIWTLFLGGFRADLLARTCERSLIECGRGK